MSPITATAENINNFFNKKAEEVSTLIGFVKSKRKLTGASFVKALVLSNIGDTNCSIDAMCQILIEESIEITKQWLDFRFTEVAVKFSVDSIFMINLTSFCIVQLRYYTNCFSHRIFSFSNNE